MFFFDRYFYHFQLIFLTLFLIYCCYFVFLSCCCYIKRLSFVIVTLSIWIFFYSQTIHFILCGAYFGGSSIKSEQKRWFWLNKYNRNVEKKSRRMKSRKHWLKTNWMRMRMEWNKTVSLIVFFCFCSFFILLFFVYCTIAKSQS